MGLLTNIEDEDKNLDFSQRFGFLLLHVTLLVVVLITAACFAGSRRKKAKNTVYEMTKQDYETTTLNGPESISLESVEEMSHRSTTSAKSKDEMKPRPQAAENAPMSLFTRVVSKAFD